MLDVIAARLSERTGRDKETIRLVLEELLNEDKDLLKTLREFSYVRQGLASGEVSQRYADIVGAKLISRMGAKLTEKIERHRMDLSELIELMKLKIIRDLLMDEKKEETKTQQPTVIKQPLIDPETGMPVRDATGNIVYVEYAVPPGMPPMIPYMPFMQARSKKEEELEKKIEELRNEMKELLEEKEKAELKDKIESIVEKISDLESEVRSLKNSGGEGGQRPSLKDLVEEINSYKQALERLGFKVVKPEAEERRESPEMALERKRVEKDYELWTKHIGPAIADLIKNPNKLVDALERLARLTGGMGAQQQQPQPVQQVTLRGPPSLEDVMRRVRPSGSGSGEGGA